MASATYLLSETNETISWTYDRFISNASLDKKDLSRLGFVTSLMCLMGIMGSLILRIPMYFYAKRSARSHSSPSSTSTSSPTTSNET